MAGGLVLHSLIGVKQYAASRSSLEPPDHSLSWADLLAFMFSIHRQLVRSSKQS